MAGLERQLAIAHEQVAYVTDIEGNMEYLLAYVAMSDALVLVSERADDGAVDLALRDGWRFVFGGDAVDKGGEVGGSIRVARTLIRLKRKYPERVTIIVGNRDINKIRITSELTRAQLDGARLESMPGPYWVPEAKRVSPVGYLGEILEQQRGAAGPPSAEELAAHNTLPNRVKWMLKETMGADGEFERRRLELATLGFGTESGPGYIELPTDAQVCDSFVRSVEEGGFMRELLHLGQLGVIIGCNLFLHGGLNCPRADASADCGTGALGLVPGRAGRIEDVGEWVEALNGWYREQLDEWVRGPTWRDDDATSELSSRGGHALIEYVVPTPAPTVVLARQLTKGGTPALPSAELMTRLNACGVRRLVVGHTPHGNCPTVIKGGGPGAAEPLLEIIMADTSYSDMKAADNRGAAVVEVELRPDGGAYVHGVLHDGTAFEYALSAGIGPPEELVGQLEPAPVSAREGASLNFVKAWLPQAGSYLLCKVDGFKTEYMTLGPQRAVAIVGGEPPGPASPGRVRLTRFHSNGDEVLVGSALGETDSKVQLLEHIFKTLDTNYNGHIEIAELKDALEQTGDFLKLFAGSGNAPWSADELFRRMDYDGGGTVSKRELRNFLVQRIAHSQRNTPAGTPEGTPGASPIAARSGPAEGDSPRRGIAASAPSPLAAVGSREPVFGRLALALEMPPPLLAAASRVCPLGLPADTTPLRSLPSLRQLGEALDASDVAEIGSALARATRPANVAFLAALATSALPAGAEASELAAAAAQSGEEAVRDAAEVRALLSQATRTTTLALLAAVLGSAPKGGGPSLADRAARASATGASGAASDAAREAQLDANESRRLLERATRERSRSILTLVGAQCDAAAARAAELPAPPPRLSPLPSMEATVLLVHPAEMRDAAHRIGAALTGEPAGARGFAPPLEGAAAYSWRVVNRYYRARLSLLVVADTTGAHPRLVELSRQVGALVLLFDRSNAESWGGLVERWGAALPDADAAPDVLLLLGDGACVGTGEEELDFSFEKGAELIAIDSSAGSADLLELAPCAAVARGEAPAPPETAGEAEGLSRVLEAVQCRRWPEDADTSPLPDAEATARLQAAFQAERQALAAAERARRDAAEEKVAPTEEVGEDAPPAAAAPPRDARAEALLAQLAGAEPADTTERDDEALERLISQMSSIRSNGANLSDEERRERAAKLALDMSRMLGEASGSELSDDEEGVLT